MINVAYVLWRNKKKKFTVAEIARVLDLPESTIRSQLKKLAELGVIKKYNKFPAEWQWDSERKTIYALLFDHLCHLWSPVLEEIGGEEYEC